MSYIVEATVALIRVSLAAALIAKPPQPQMGKMVVDAKRYAAELPSMFVDNFEWGGYVERVYFAPFCCVIFTPVTPGLATAYAAPVEAPIRNSNILTDFSRFNIAVIF